jgi:ABC-type transport system substrate-binding protein
MKLSAWILSLWILGLGILNFQSCSQNTNDNQGRDLISLSLNQRIEHLDPHLATTQSQLQLVSLIYDSLIAYNDQGQLEPQILSHWEIKQNGLRYELYVKPDLRFHNGTSLNAVDIEDSLKRVMSEELNSPYRDLFKPIETIERPNDNLLIINLNQRYSSFLRLLASPWLAILPDEQARELVPRKSNYIGSGPYVFVGDFLEINSLSSVLETYELFVNSNYQSIRAGLTRNRPNLKFLVLPDYRRRVNALINNEIDLLGQVQSRDWAIFQSMDGFQSSRFPSSIIYGVQLLNPDQYDSQEKKELFQVFQNQIVKDLEISESRINLPFFSPQSGINASVLSNLDMQDSSDSESTVRRQDEEVDFQPALGYILDFFSESWYF